MDGQPRSTSRSVHERRSVCGASSGRNLRPYKRSRCWKRLYAASIGVRRVSVGGSLYRATMAKFRELVSQLLATGSLQTEPAPLTDRELNELFSSPHSVY
jgi:2-methylisocitrate lyase-like PEP mutase family enzyme